MKKITTDISKINKLLLRGVEEVLVKDHLKELLLSGKILRVKLGIDPTSPDLHLGHTVPLRKLREFQDLGHTAVLIIGDYTAMIGDPTGRSEERKPLTREEVKSNMKKYLAQAGKVIDVKKAEIVYNSSWYAKERMEHIVELSRAGTLQQVLHRADFKKRIKEGQDINMAEIFYPLLQGYDSVKVKADVELGGTDQKFNLLIGRRVQRHFGLAEQDIITVPLIEGTDGVKKMSKSADNYVSLDEKPDEMFGKIMAIPDSLIDKYYTCLTDKDREIDDLRKAKLDLAKIIVSQYHGPDLAQKAEAEFIKVFSKKEKPEDIKKLQLGVKEIDIVELLAKTGLAGSKSEARRLILQGAVKINDVKKSDPNEKINLAKEILIQVGPRRFLKVGL